MTTKPTGETPEEHVHESVSRQEQAAKEVKTIAKKVARTANDKAHVLAVATEVLSSRVGTLADAVQINNAKIDDLQKELNKKPDDAEVRFITGMAATERNRHLRYALATSVVAALFAGAISYTFAEREIAERTRQANIACERGNFRSEISASVYDDIRKSLPKGPVADRLEKAANEIRKTQADCDNLHPIGQNR